MAKSDEKITLDNSIDRLIQMSINPRVVISVADDRILYFNSQYSDRFGYSAEELKDKKEFELWANPKFRQNWKTLATRDGQVSDFSAYVFDSGGEIRTVIINSIIIEYHGEPAYLNELYDLTEKEKIATNLQSSILKLHDSMESMIKVIAHTVEMKDPYTAGHQKRVSQIATEIAKGMQLDQDLIEGIRIAGLIHDIGKIAIPVEILSKPGKLSSMEFELIKTHSKNGYEILKDVEFAWPLAEIVYQHHERSDGSGYPRGLKKNEILLESRIIMVADVVEAISCHRPYRPSLGMEVAKTEILKFRGTFFDTDIVDQCLALIDNGTIT